MSKLIKTNFGEVNCDCKTCLEFAHFFEEISKQQKTLKTIAAQQFSASHNH
jgi:hypothetical protein